MFYNSHQGVQKIVSAVAHKFRPIEILSTLLLKIGTNAVSRQIPIPFKKWGKCETKLFRAKLWHLTNLETSIFWHRWKAQVFLSWWHKFGFNCCPITYIPWHLKQATSIILVSSAAMKFADLSVNGSEVTWSTRAKNQEQRLCLPLPTFRISEFNFMYDF